MDSVRLFLQNPIVQFVGLIGGLLTIYEFVRYQFGWKHGIINHVRQRSKQVTEGADDIVAPQVIPMAPAAAPDASSTVGMVDRKGRPVPPPISDTERTNWIKRSLVTRFSAYGDQARYDFFEERRRKSPPGKEHRFAFVDLASQPRFAALAEGLKEWCKIGFDALVHKTPVLQNEDTMDRLYTALLKELLSEQLRAEGTQDFAYAWSERVRDHRSDGY